MSIFGKVNLYKPSMTALQFIELSDVTFTLTGSRFFGTNNEESDWDFFAPNDPKTEKILIDAGFIREFESEDRPLDYIGFPGIIKLFEKENVHIQLINNCRVKWFVQNEILRPVFSALKPNKVQARLLWKQAIKAYQAGMDEHRRLNSVSKSTTNEMDAYDRHRAGID